MNAKGRGGAVPRAATRTPHAIPTQRLRATTADLRYFPQRKTYLLPRNAADRPFLGG